MATPPDPAAIDAAVHAALTSDPVLALLAVDGVWFDAAPQSAQALVILGVIDASTIPAFGVRAFEARTYQIEFRELAHESDTAAAAAARIDVVLDCVDLAIAGWSHQGTRKLGYIRATEIDDTDRSLRWQRRGGRYEVVASYADA